MKKIYILFFMLLAGTYLASAQSSLQFNQVVLVNGVNQTVPQGKVWKVESVVSGYSYPISSNCSSASNNGNYATALYIDNAIYFSDVSNHAGTTYSSVMFNGSQSFPFWLPAGTNLRAACSSSLVSVIEFNMVP